MFKPKWYYTLPETFRPVNTIRQLEKLRKQHSIPEEVFAFIVMGSRWATHLVQTVTYIGAKEMHPELSKDKLLRKVLLSALEAMEENGYISIYEIDLDLVMTTIHSIDDITSYIVKLQESIEPKHPDALSTIAKVEDILKQGEVPINIRI